MLIMPNIGAVIPPIVSPILDVLVKSKFFHNAGIVNNSTLRKESRLTMIVSNINCLYGIRIVKG